uniref:Uncharacterized protein n=1 Tax=Vespula pensylvanica TaxID=30213 RepID=A0A834P1W3_VESPE|nr:hypothetical protein H0235_009135 [Vespula pensylvanica]
MASTMVEGMRLGCRKRTQPAQQGWFYRRNCCHYCCCELLITFPRITTLDRVSNATDGGGYGCIGGSADGNGSASWGENEAHGTLFITAMVGQKLLKRWTGGLALGVDDEFKQRADTDNTRVFRANAAFNLTLIGNSLLCALQTFQPASRYFPRSPVNR